MTPLLLIPAALLGIAIGFWAGIRYAAQALLPGIMARLSPERLREVAKEAARIRQPKTE